MKTKYSFLTKIVCTLLSLCICSIGFAQGVVNESGSSNSSSHTGGMTIIGTQTGNHLSLDNNEVQARSGASASILYANFYGGDIDLLGAFNSAGDLKVDGSGLVYDNSSDRVGIGTNTPSTALHIAQGTGEQIRLDGANPWISFYDGATYNGYLYHTGTNMSLYNRAAGSLFFGTNNTVRATITTAGDVGFGTTTPDGRFEIAHNSSITDPHIDIHENSTSDFARINFTSNSTDYWALAGAGGTTDRFNIYYNDGTTGTNVVSIDGPGERFGVNISPTYTSHISHETGVPGATSGNGLTIDNDAGSANHWTMYNWSSGNLSLYNAGTLRGTFSATNGVYTSSSDRRVKSNINEMGNMMDKIMSLKPSTYTFNFDETNETQFGLIAQEVQVIFPELTPIIESVSEGAAYDKLGVSYTELVPVLIKGMQEQQAIIEQLKADVAELKNK